MTLPFRAGDAHRALDIATHPAAAAGRDARDYASAMDQLKQAKARARLIAGPLRERHPPFSGNASATTELTRAGRPR